MKKFLLSAVAFAALSTTAFAANDDSAPYNRGLKEVESYSEVVTPKVIKKRLYYGDATSAINAVGESDQERELRRISEKGGNNRDLAPL